MEAVAGARDFPEYSLLPRHMNALQLSTSEVQPLESVQISSLHVFRSVDCQDPETSQSAILRRWSSWIISVHQED